MPQAKTGNGAKTGKGAGNGNGSSTEKGNVRRMLEQLDAIREGDLQRRLDAPFKDADMRKIQESVNALVVELEEHTEEFRDSTMQLALGLSDCFRVLSEVRGGNLATRVDEATMASDDELMANLGATLNETIAEFETQMGTIKRQQEAIEHLVKQLQTPILQLWDDVLALPVIGMVDTKRSAEMMEVLLHEVVERQCKYVILDVTGVEVVDTKTADHFIKVMKAAELLGTRCILTGIRPAVAQTLVELGVDLSSIATLRNLKEGLKECLRSMEAADRLRVQSGKA